MFKEEIMQLVVNLNGAMLRKAEIEGSFSDFYLKIFNKIFTEDFSSEEDFLYIFGNMGG